MKKIDFTPTPNFKVYDNTTRSNEIKEIVEKDDEKFLDFEMYENFYKYAHKNLEFHKQVHYLRYMNTAGILFSNLGEINNKNILETGGHSPLSIFLASNNNCYHTQSDLRVEIDAPNEFADLIICCEVIEHIKDQNPNNLQELTLFTTNGVKKFANEVNRVLKPGGSLLLTTPNANSLWSIIRAVRYQDPYVFRGHVREYTKQELIDIFSNFEVSTYKSLYNFRLIKEESRKQIIDKFHKIGWGTKERGDNHVFLFKKLN